MIIECRVCNKSINVKPSRIKRTKNICCSKKCSNDLRKITMLGENNHQYGVKGEDNSSYKGGRLVNVNGYIELLNHTHPFSRWGYILEHRLVAEKYLLNESNMILVDGVSYLNPELEVHHIDGDRTNNSHDNLQILTKSEHRRYHNLISPNFRCEDTGRFSKKL